MEDTVIPARVMYDIFTDENGKKHVITAFMPVLFDDADMYSSEREIEIINSLLSDSPDYRQDLAEGILHTGSIF